MSTPNTLSFLLQFKTDVTVLDKAVSWLEKAQKRVQEYNATMQNGTRAINAGLQAAAGLFAVSAVKGYVDEAVEMRKAQGQLDQALRQSGKYSAEYSKQLAEQADALETATGVDSTRVAAVQRELVLAGVRKQDLADLTALTLDYAAAREIEAGAAAKLVGQTLRGEGDSIRGLGVELDLSKGRVEALKTAFGQFKGQAVEAIAALPPELRAFEKASGDAKKAAGQFVLEISAPALAGFAKGLKETEGWLQRITGTGNGTTTVLRSISSALGSFVGSHLTTILALAGGFLALKAGMFAVQQVSVTLGAAWVGLAGQQFLPMIAAVQTLSREFGILKAVTAGGWASAVGTAGLVVADAVAFYQLGKYLGGLPQKQLDKIRTDLDGQTMALLAQIEAAKSLNGIEEARAKAIADQKSEAAEIAALEAKKAAAANPDNRNTGISWGAGYGSVSSVTAVPRFGDADALRLAALQKRQVELQALIATVSDPKWQQQKIDSSKPQAERDAEALRAELVRKKELLGLENQLIAAQADRNQPEIDRLQRLIEEKKLTEDLKGFGTEAAALVQSRLSAEDQARAKARKEQLDNYDLTTQQTLAELAANRAEQDRLALLDYEKKARIEIAALGLSAGESEARVQARVQAEQARLSRESQLAVLKAQSTSAEAELARVEQQRSNITGNTLLDETTKRRRLTENTEEYRRVLAKVLELKLQERKLAVDAAEQAVLDAEIKRLQASADTYGLSDLQPGKIQATRNAYADRSNPESHYQSTQDGLAGGAMEFATGLGTTADSAAAAVNGTLNQALTSTADILDGLIWRSSSFKDLWNNAVVAVEKQFTRMATEMVVKMLWRSTVERALIRLGVIEHTTGEATKTAATTTGSGIRILTTIKEALASVYHGAVAAFEAMASIPYVGPFLAAAAMAAALAGGIALVSKIGHAEGGYIAGPGTGTSDSIPAMLSNGEYVIPAARVQQYGVGFFETIRAGALGASGLAARAEGGLVARGDALQAVALATTPYPSGEPVAAASSSGKGDMHLAILDKRTDVENYLAGRRGRRMLYDAVKGVLSELG